jgi:LacI family transcriptional regulator
MNTPRSKRPSIKEVASRAGVSTATVSHVFSGKRRVNEDLSKRVRHAADELGYSVDRVASQLRTGKVNIVAVIVPDLEDLFLNRLVALLENCAREAGYELIVASSGNNQRVEASRIRSLLAWRPAGLIIGPCKELVADEVIRDLDDVPVVAADRIQPSPTHFDTVTVDNFGSGRLAAQHLADQGVTSVLALAGDASLFSLRERLRGMSEVPSISAEVLEIGSDPVRGAAKVVHHLKTNPRPAAVVGLTNVTTLASLSAFAELGLEVPRDILLLGFHDSLWMTARKTPITTVAQPVDEVAKTTWERLMRRIDGDNSPPISVTHAATLIPRSSTRNEITLRPPEPIEA